MNYPELRTGFHPEAGYMGFLRNFAPDFIQGLSMLDSYGVSEVIRHLRQLAALLGVPATKNLFYPRKNSNKI